MLVNDTVNTGGTTYLHRLRIDQAKRLLGTTELSVADIGSAAGFGDLSRFNKSFLKHAGMTPTEYRRRASGNERPKKSNKRLAGPTITTLSSESEITSSSHEHGDGQ